MEKDWKFVKNTIGEMFKLEQEVNEIKQKQNNCEFMVEIGEIANKLFKIFWNQENEIELIDYMCFSKLPYVNRNSIQINFPLDIFSKERKVFNEVIPNQIKNCVSKFTLNNQYHLCKNKDKLIAGLVTHIRVDNNENIIIEFMITLYKNKN